MDATTAVQSSGQARSAGSESGETPSLHPVMFGSQLHASSIMMTPEGYSHALDMVHLSNLRPVVNWYYIPMATVSNRLTTIRGSYIMVMLMVTIMQCDMVYLSKLQPVVDCYAARQRQCSKPLYQSEHSVRRSLCCDLHPARTARMAIDPFM